MDPVLSILAVLVIGTLAAVLGVFLILFMIRFFKGFFRAVGWVINHIFRFIAGMLSDLFRSIGAVLAAIALSLLVVLNVVIARWSNANHFGRALKDELSTAARAMYRVCIGHPARFLLLSGLTEGVEVRVANAVAGAPGSDKPSKRTGEFDGYTIVGSLKGGGSGGKLFVAEPDNRKRSAFDRRGIADVEQVVIKSFSLKDGSSMPQIVRESRALEAAKKLGLVLEHELSDERFYYVMPYVPGESLGTVTQRLHAESGSGGLDPRQMRYTLGLIAELLGTLSVYHRGGLWHKDIKPDNIIVSGDHATLVDLGLVTPLRSAMTLTTHGTEYFRDPEMVRMALRGAKVHEVDGVKFDIYGAGAVLFSAIENSFPAHGGLSQLSKRCPEALRWIIRRSMAELSQRYASAEEMLADLRVVMEAPDPFTLKPKDLPSMGGRAAIDAPAPPDFEPVGAVAGASHAEASWASADTPRPHHAPFAPPAVAPPAAPVGRKPRFKVQDWLTGRYSVEDVPFGRGRQMPPPPARPAQVRHSAHTPVPPRRRSPLTAAEQRASAQQRVRAAQQRARQRRSARNQKFSTNPNRGAMIGVVLVGALLVLGGFAFVNMQSDFDRFRTGAWTPDGPVVGLHIIDTSDRATLWLTERNLAMVMGSLATGTDSGEGRARFLEGEQRIVTPADLRALLNPSEGPDQGVLVIDSLSQGASDDVRWSADWLISSLHDTGLPLRGTGADEADIDLIAPVRAIVGVSGIMSANHSRLREWLGQTPEIDSLIWIESAPESQVAALPKAVRAVLITEADEAVQQARLLSEKPAAGAAGPASPRGLTAPAVPSRF